MSDLRTEIVSKVLNSWEKPMTETKAPSLSEKVFNYIHLNPSSTSVQVSEGTGIDIGRASALMLALYGQGKLGRKQYPNPNRDGIHANVYAYWTEVESFSQKGVSRKPKKEKKLKKVVIKPLDELKAKALQKVIDGDIKIDKQVSEKLDPEIFVNGLNVRDAKKIFLLLKRIFE